MSGSHTRIRGALSSIVAGPFDILARCLLDAHQDNLQNKIID